ncbi:hypothetical protein Hanom_Chr02g00110071 [Helianthus anomalus]
MQFRRPKDKVPNKRMIAYEGMPWYETLTARQTPMWQLEEEVLFAEGMSMLWAPENPREAPGSFRHLKFPLSSSAYFKESQNASHE